MSITVIVVLTILISTLVGIKVYLEHREEDKLKNELNNGDFSDLQNLILDSEKPIIVEEKEENQLKVEDPSPVFLEADYINSYEASKESKPKKAKRKYYPKNKKTQSKKQTNKTK